MAERRTVKSRSRSRASKRSRSSKGIEEALNHVATADEVPVAVEEEKAEKVEKPKTRRRTRSKSSEEVAPETKKVKRSKKEEGEGTKAKKGEAEAEEAPKVEKKEIPLSEDDSFFVEGDKGMLLDLFRSAGEYVSASVGADSRYMSILLTVNPEDSSVTATGESEDDAGEFTVYGEFSTNSPDVRRFIVDPERILTALSIIDGDTVSLNYDPEEKSLHVRDCDAPEGQGQDSDIRINDLGELAPVVPNYIEDERIVFEPGPLLQAYNQVESCTDRDGVLPIAASVFAEVDDEGEGDPVLRLVGASNVAIGLSTSPLVETEGDALRQILFSGDGFAKAASHIEGGERCALYVSEESADSDKAPIIILVVRDGQGRTVAKIRMMTYSADPKQYPIANLRKQVGKLHRQTSLLVSANFPDFISTMDKAHRVLRLNDVDRALIHLEFSGEGKVRIYSEGDMKTSRNISVRPAPDSDDVNDSLEEEFTIDYPADVSLHVAQSYSGDETAFLALAWDEDKETYTALTLTDRAGAQAIVEGRSPNYAVTPLLAV